MEEHATGVAVDHGDRTGAQGSALDAAETAAKPKSMTMTSELASFS